MRALSIRQPYAELILRGIKTCEYRSRPTSLLGERFWIYASSKDAGATKRRSDGATKGEGGRNRGKAFWSTDLRLPDEKLPDWMIELAEQVKLIKPGTDLPRGVIVGSAVIDRCEAVDPWPLSPNGAPMYRWRLADVRRDAHRKPLRRPQPVWFRPFQD